MTVINTNIKALYTQAALKESGRASLVAMQQLSTGKRINSSKDDAAGLAIAARMTQNIQGLNQSIRRRCHFSDSGCRGCHQRNHHHAPAHERVGGSILQFHLLHRAARVFGPRISATQTRDCANFGNPRMEWFPNFERQGWNAGWDARIDNRPSGWC